MEQALFRDANEAFRFQMDVIIRMTSLIAWVLLAIAHLALVVLLLALAWCFRWEPSALATLVQRIAGARPVVAFLAAGGSVLGLMAGYWKLVRWAHQASTRGWLARYLTRV